MENWDANRINELFIRRSQAANPERYLNKPKHEAFEELRLVEEAIRDLNRWCAKNCWQKDKFIGMLDLLISHSTLPFPDKPAVYVETYLAEAKNIKELIVSDKLN